MRSQDNQLLEAGLEWWIKLWRASSCIGWTHEMNDDMVKALECRAMGDGQEGDARALAGLQYHTKHVTKSEVASHMCTLNNVWVPTLQLPHEPCLVACEYHAKLPCGHCVKLPCKCWVKLEPCP